MTDKAQVMRIYNQLMELKRVRPDVYELWERFLDLPEDKQTEFMIEAMPILRHGLN